MALGIYHFKSFFEWSTQSIDLELFKICLNTVGKLNCFINMPQYKGEIVHYM